MGASSSVNCNIKNNIYISYSENDVNAGLLHDELVNSGHNIIKCSTAFIEKYNLSIDAYSCMFEKVMSESYYIIICISDKTVSSFYQAIEIDYALNSNTNIIYVMTDAHFTPENTFYLNGVVRHNKWLPAYDSDTLTSAVDEFDVLLEKPK
jgi:hypothetical protein